MNNLETIQYLAQAEAKHFAPLRTDVIMEDIEIPRLSILKSSCGTYSVEMQGHQGHDNEGRAPLVCSFMRSSVLANVDPTIDASGVYPLELHDSYSYLAADSPEHRAKYKGALSFSKNMAHGHTIAFPDPYQITGYGGMLGVHDTLEFEKKRDIVLFAGTTTGSRDPLKNARINACRWAINRRPEYQFYITNVAQMTVDDVRSSVPECDAIFHQPISHDDHFQCKYIFNIQGNTCCWSRVPMIMNSRSLMLNLRHADGAWYYPLMHDGQHFVNVANLDALPSTVQYCASNPAWCKHIVANANQFVKNYCGQVHAAYYAKCLIETMALNK